MNNNHNKELKWDQVLKTMINICCSHCLHFSYCIFFYPWWFFLRVSAILCETCCHIHFQAHLSTNQHSTDPQCHPRQAKCSWDFGWLQGSTFVLVENRFPWARCRQELAHESRHKLRIRHNNDTGNTFLATLKRKHHSGISDLTSSASAYSQLDMKRSWRDMKTIAILPHAIFFVNDCASSFISTYLPLIFLLLSSSFTNPFN